MASHGKDTGTGLGAGAGTRAAASHRAVALAERSPAATDLVGLAGLQRSAGNAAVALGIQRSPKPGGGGGCRCGGQAGPDGECAACRARRLAGLSVQRAPLSPATAVASATADIAAEGFVVSPGWLVEDGAEGVGPGQATKSMWLSELRLAICDRADSELAGTPQSTDGCPFIGFWIGYFSGRAAAEISAAAVRYAPELAGVATARDAIAPIVDRVGEAVAVWVQTGQITGVPPGVAALGAGPIGGDGTSPGGGGGDGAVQRKGAGGTGGGGAAGGGPSAAGGSIPGGGGAARGGLAGAGPSASNPVAILGRLGDGRPLDTGVRSRMEPLFGQDFSAVRVHDDHEAAALSTGLDAHAFTVGQHIALGSDAGQPGTLAGDALLAHELAHVVQQAGASRSGAPLRDGTPAYEAFEQDADTSAAGVVASLWGGAKAAVAAGLAGAVPRLRAGVGVQRCRRTVYHCPKGKSWQQLPNPTGAGPVCICQWKCLPGESLGTHQPRGYGNQGPAISCPAGGCPDPNDHEEIPEETIVKGPNGRITDYSGGIKLAPGAHFTPVDGAPMCGCLPLDVKGGPTGDETTYTPMIQPSGLELTDVVPGRAAKAIEQLEGRASRGPGETDPLPTKAPMTQEPPPAPKTPIKPPVVVEPTGAGKLPAVTPETPAKPAAIVTPDKLTATPPEPAAATTPEKPATPEGKAAGEGEGSVGRSEGKGTSEGEGARRGENVQGAAERITAEDVHTEDIVEDKLAAPSGKDAKVTPAICFPTGTPVHVSGAIRPIEAIRVGDLVLAWDDKAQAVASRRVTELIRGATATWVDIELVAAESLRSTPAHRFWVESVGAWLRAGELAPGMPVRLINGRITQVRAARLVSVDSEATFNLSVDDLETFFVGGAGVLVHNMKMSRYNRLNRGGFSNYVLRAGGPRGRVYYSGMFGPGDGPVGVARRHAANRNRFDPETDFIDVRRGTRTYGEARTMENELANKYKTVIGRDGNNYRGNRQQPLADEKLPEYKEFLDIKAQGNCG